MPDRNLEIRNGDTPIQPLALSSTCLGPSQPTVGDRTLLVAASDIDKGVVLVLHDDRQIEAVQRMPGTVNLRRFQVIDDDEVERVRRCLRLNKR